MRFRGPPTSSQHTTFNFSFLSSTWLLRGENLSIMRLSLFIFQLLILHLTVVFASSGDRSSDFINCVSSCDTNFCANDSTIPPLSTALRLTRWTCLDDCKYGCMHLITDEAVRAGAPIHQYYGKWPFWRLWGMQEPASVAFSLLNLFVHIRGGLLVGRRMSTGHPMKPYFILFTVVNVNAWIWSAVFHTRDLPFTEKMDYLSAAATILYGLYYSVVRLYHLYPVHQRLLLIAPPKSRLPHIIWTLMCSLVYMWHVLYLTLMPRFDYSYNMAFNITIGMIHNFLWILYSLPASLPILRRFPTRPKTYRPAYVSKAAVLVMATTAAMCLELFDFPPWERMIDAHSLWHLATVPIASYWYDFILEDSMDEGWRGRARG